MAATYWLFHTFNSPIVSNVLTISSIFIDVFVLQISTNLSKQCVFVPNIFDTAIALWFSKCFHDYVCPIASEANSTQITQWLLWRTYLSLQLWKFVGKGNQKLAITRSLDKGKTANASQIISFLWIFIFREVSNLLISKKTECKELVKIVIRQNARTMWLPSSSSSQRT